MCNSQRLSCSDGATRDAPPTGRHTYKGRRNHPLNQPRNGVVSSDCHNVSPCQRQPEAATSPWPSPRGRQGSARGRRASPRGRGMPSPLPAPPDYGGLTLMPACSGGSAALCRLSASVRCPPVVPARPWPCVAVCGRPRSRPCPPMAVARPRRDHGPSGIVARVGVVTRRPIGRPRRPSARGNVSRGLVVTSFAGFVFFNTPAPIGRGTRRRRPRGSDPHPPLL